MLDVLFGRLPSFENTSTPEAMQKSEPAHVFREEFSMAVSPVKKIKLLHKLAYLCINLHTVYQECFESLLHLLNCSWVTFTAVAVDTGVIHGNNLAALRLDLDRFVAISTACLRLIRMYICEVYPNTGQNEALSFFDGKKATFFFSWLFQEHRMHSAGGMYRGSSDPAETNFVRW